MVTLYRQRNWKVAVYGREHVVPHFHVEVPGFRCSVSIATGGLIVGDAPTEALAEARLWAAANPAVLAATWKELNP